MLMETYLRQQVEKGEYGVAIIQAQIALDIADYIEKHRQPERKTGRWIPCKPVNDNYLPDLKDDYKMILVTYRTGRSMVRKVKACLCDHGRLEKKVPGIVTAWMPYPDPYVEIEL